MSPGRLTMYDRELHLDWVEPLAVGDTVPVIRGNGPREGERMGTATVTGFDDDRGPILHVHIDGGPPAKDQPSR